MKVSVLIPVYNGSKYISAAIESVLAQTFKDIEIIVIDDGSLDETAAIVKRYEHVRYIYQNHSGVSAARNRALKEARAELISFLDSDDLILPTKIEKQLAYLDEYPECEIVFCPYQNFSSLRVEDMTQRQRQIMREENIICLAGALIRASLFERWGKFSLKRNYGEDTEWLTGVKIGGVNMSHSIEDKLYLRRIHNENLSLTHPRVVGKEFLSLKADCVRRSIKGKNND